MIRKFIMLIMKILIIIFIFQMINLPVVNATENLSETIKDGQTFIQNGRDSAEKDEGKDNSGGIDNGKVKKTTDKLYNILLAIGIAASVIVGGILGIQIMWGSIELQVKAKEMLMPYAAGCIVTFGAFGIWKICIELFSQL